MLTPGRPGLVWSVVVLMDDARGRLEPEEPAQAFGDVLDDRPILVEFRPHPDRDHVLAVADG